MGDESKRAALITGAARRIGRAIAERLCAEGYGVALHASARSAADGDALVRTLQAKGAKAQLVVADLADVAACEQLVSDATGAVGRMSLLVNNAALFEPDSPESIDVALWERQFAVNLRAPVLLAQHFAAQAEAGSNASIINMIDQRVLRPTPHFFSYTLTKSALWTATRTMAQAFADRGIRVNAIGPGPVLPNANDGMTGFEREVENVPLQRAVSPRDLTDAVLYLAAARGVTGQIIAVDAGQHLAWRTPDIVD